MSPSVPAVIDMKMDPAVPAKPQAMTDLLAELAQNPNVDVAKYERFLDMQERILERSAKEAFNVAYLAMSEELPVIDERGRVLGKTGNVQSQYAKFEDIQRITMPILRRHGFAMSYRTEWPTPEKAKIIGILTHKEGHSRESEFLSAADTSGNKNAVQGLGSVVSYGRRYTTIDLLNLVTVGADDDGAASARQGVESPQGFDQAWLDIQMTADDGLEALTKAWKALKPQIRNHAFQHYRLDWEKLKRAAAKVDADRSEAAK